MANNDDKNIDDFFGNQADDERTEEERRQREWDALRRPHYNAGLREGGSAAHDANLQQGFDDGFAAGARAVAQTAFAYGASSVTLAFFAKHGCYSRAEQRVQKLGDTEVPTASLKRLRQSIVELSDSIQKIRVDGTLENSEALKALRDVALVEIPSSMQTVSKLPS